ncbi:MAG: RNA polymerase sigma factor [Planctomycetota bacterium]|jgi:RNA polymerase sigma-70 factor (ECF subfamily)
MAVELKHNMAGDRQLVRAALLGETSAFGAIVEKYWNMVVALALSKVSDTAEAEDIAQESFLKAYSQLSSLKDPSRLAGWLSKITMQQCSNSLRRKVRSKRVLGTRTIPIEVLNEQPAIAVNPGLTLNQIQFVRRAVRNLPEKFRTLIIMRFVAGFSTVKIAEQLGKRPGTVRVRLHRAYKLLRKDLTPILEEVES